MKLGSTRPGLAAALDDQVGSVDHDLGDVLVTQQLVDRPVARMSSLTSWMSCALSAADGGAARPMAAWSCSWTRRRRSSSDRRRSNRIGAELVDELLVDPVAQLVEAGSRRGAGAGWAGRAAGPPGISGTCPEGPSPEADLRRTGPG